MHTDEAVRSIRITAPDIVAADYLNLPSIILDGLYIKINGETRIYYHKGNNIYMVTLSSESAGTAIKVTALQKVTQSDIDDARLSGDIVREEL